jgi:hypothetical protein
MWSGVTRNRRHRRPHRAAVHGDSPTSTPTPPIYRRSVPGMPGRQRRPRRPPRTPPPPPPSPTTFRPRCGCCPPANLHADVLVTSRRAAAGSAGASQGSTIADRVVMITDDPDTITDHPGSSTPPTRSPKSTTHSNATTTEIWKIGRIVLLPGIGGRIRAESEFLPTSFTRMFLWHSIDYETFPAELQKRDTHTTQRRTTAGPAANDALESFRLDTPGGRRTGRLVSPCPSARRPPSAPPRPPSASARSGGPPAAGHRSAGSR